jgi:hypothetical protein
MPASSGGSTIWYLEDSALGPLTHELSEPAGN